MTRNYTYILFSIIVLLVSCGKESVPEGDYIAFSGEATQASLVTKTEKMDSKAELQSESFGIYGFRSANDQAGFQNVFETTAAEEVSHNGTEWTYSPKQKWIRSNYYRFRAFWPYTARINEASNANLLAIDYSTETEQYDLLLAYSTRYPVTEGVSRVPMVFNHALAGISFKIKFADSSDGTDAVTDFYLTGLSPTGTLLYGIDDSDADTETDKRDFNWISTYVDTESKLLTWEGEKPFSSTVTATVYNEDGLKFVIPQVPSSAVGNETYVNFYTKNAGSNALHRAQIPNTEWEAGKIYIYTITVKGAKITLTVDIKDWTALDSNIDINL